MNEHICVMVVEHDVSGTPLRLCLHPEERHYDSTFQDELQQAMDARRQTVGSHVFCIGEPCPKCGGARETDGLACDRCFGFGALEYLDLFAPREGTATDDVGCS